MKTLRFFLIAILIFSANAVFSAPAPPPSGGTTGTPTCWPPPCVPIDNGIILLVAAGVLYTAKKFYDLRKRAQAHS